MNFAAHPTEACPRPDEHRLAIQLAALAHPARIRILRHVAGCEACCCKDVVGCLELAQSTVSQHLKTLVEAGLVRMSTEGRRSRYEADREALRVLSATLGDLLHACCGMPAAACDETEA